MIDRRSEADLIWYFSEGSRMFSRSTFGGMLERAQVMNIDSSGARIPRPDRHAWNVVPIAHTRQEPSYTPDDEALGRLASVSRRLRLLRREDAIVLHAYYGDIGERWARTKSGRLFAIYALTAAGVIVARGGRDDAPCAPRPYIRRLRPPARPGAHDRRS